MTIRRRAALFAKKKLKLRNPSGVVARLPFNPKEACKAINTDSYQAQYSNWKNIGYIETEKIRLGTPTLGLCL